MKPKLEPGSRKPRDAALESGPWGVSPTGGQSLVFCVENPEVDLGLD